MLIPATLLPACLALGWSLAFECPGGMRVDGPACVVRWLSPGRPVYP